MKSMQVLYRGLFLLCFFSSVTADEIIQERRDSVICFSTLLDLGLQVWDDTRQLAECYDSGSEQLLKDIILGRLTRLHHEIKTVAGQIDALGAVIMVSDLELVRSIIAQIEKEFYHQGSDDASSAIVAPLARSICADIKELI